MSKRLVFVPIHFSLSSCSAASWKASKSLHTVPVILHTHLSRHPVRPNDCLRSTTDFTSVLIVALAASSLVAGSIYLSETQRKPKDYYQLVASPRPTEPANLGIMMSPTLPGRPGNLTAEQEARLQELWTVTLRVFGVQAPDRPEDVEHQQQSGSLTATPDKKAKKKKNSIFRRHNGDNDEGASADQEDKYGQGKDFQQVLATVDPEKLRNAFWSMVKHDHPDGLLLRFLRARKWDVHNALVMLIATMNWRMKEQRVDDDIMKNGEGQAAANSSSSNAAVNREAEDFLAQLRLGKSFLHGTDREGRPMCFVRVRLHKQGEQSNTSLERYTVYTIETARLLLASNVDTAVGYSKKHVKIPAYDLAGDRLRYDWFLNGQHGWPSLYSN